MVVMSIAVTQDGETRIPIESPKATVLSLVEIHRVVSQDQIFDGSEVGVSVGTVLFASSELEPGPPCVEYHHSRPSQ